jgi:type VI secretion system ImpB/VipA family protein
MSMPVEVSFMPMKILVLGHFDGSNVENPQHLKVNKDNFQNIFSELNPRLYMRVANKLTSAPKELNIDLIFTGMDSFLPKAITDRIEVIKEAVKVRKALHNLAQKQITLNETKNAISDSAVVNSQIPDIVAIIEDHIKSEKEIEPQILDNAISKLDSALSDQFDEILHNPKFQQLESAWRGLKLLLENADLKY